MKRIELDSLINPDTVCQQLIRAGMSIESAEQKGPLFAKSAQALIQAGHSPSMSAFALFVPGRIEVLGKHTDYGGGRSLTAAIERGFCAVAVANQDNHVQVLEVDGQGSVEFSLSPDLAPPAGHWSNYPITVGRRLARNFGDPEPLRGAAIAFASDLPLASGMSSSSAFIITMLLLLSDVNKLPERPAYQRNIRNTIDLAGYAATIENGQSFRELAGDLGVGTFGGSEDHTAILGASAGKLGQYSYCPARKERSIAMPDGLVFAIASSGVVAEKTGAAMLQYNRASELAASVAEVWRNATGRDDPHIAAALASGPGAVESIREALAHSEHSDFTPHELLTRFEHFFVESEKIVPAVPDQITTDERSRFGDLVERSQHLSETQLGNQVPETIFLAKTAHELGASAASAFGAGFGGSVWAWIEREQTTEFLDAWADRYHEVYPLAAGNSSFFSTGAGPSAMALF